MMMVTMCVLTQTLEIHYTPSYINICACTRSINNDLARLKELARARHNLELLTECLTVIFSRIMAGHT